MLDHLLHDLSIFDKYPQDRSFLKGYYTVRSVELLKHTNPTELDLIRSFSSQIVVSTQQL